MQNRKSVSQNATRSWCPAWKISCDGFSKSKILFLPSLPLTIFSFEIQEGYLLVATYSSNLNRIGFEQQTEVYPTFLLTFEKTSCIDTPKTAGHFESIGESLVLHSLKIKAFDRVGFQVESILIHRIIKPLSSFFSDLQSHPPKMQASSQPATSTQIYSSNQNGLRQSRNRRPRTADLTIQVHKDENRDLFQQRPSRTGFSSQPQSPTHNQRKKEEKQTLSLGSSSKRMSMPFHFSDYARETSATSTNLRFQIHTSPNPTTPITTTSPISRSENQRGDLSFRRPLLGGRSKSSGERRPKTSNGLEGGFCDRITSDLSSFSFFDEPSRAERGGMGRSTSNQGSRRDQDQRFSYLFSPQDEKSQTTTTSTSKTYHRNSIM